MIILSESVCSKCNAPFLLFHKIQNIFKSISARKSLKGQIKLHLACGDHILDTWANIDITKKMGVITHNLTSPLPLESGTVSFIFSEHFIEHLTFDQAKELLSECNRVLKPNGILRISTPNLKKIIDEYLTGRISEWTDVGFSPSTPCRMMNEAMRSWGHQFLYDSHELEALLQYCGFRELTHVAWHDSIHTELRNLECRPFHGEIIIEAMK